ncbi:MAG: DUF4390 domain-containing protein [Deltaproteobacteria bacterium]|nr:DUF4390 domain-containing protein [Deltaproteobacteria bacterium]
MKTDSNISERFSSLLLPILLCLLLNLIPAHSAYAQKASITDFTVSNSKSQILLYLTVTDCFTGEMEDAIHNGIPATFTFYVEIYRQRSRWPDRKIKKYEFNHIIEYDSLKKEYKVRREEKNDYKMTSSLGDAKLLMSEINGFAVLPLEEIDPKSFYIIRVKAKLARKTLPLYFHYLIPFTSLWDFETEWYDLKLNLGQ